MKKDAISNNVSEHFIGLISSDIWSTHETPISLAEEKKVFFSRLYCPRFH